jgi:hypothetical protein
MITASIHIDKSAFEPDKVPKPQLNLGWFVRAGKNHVNESISLNGGRLAAISIEQGEGRACKDATIHYCHLSFVSFEDAKKAFQVPVYKVTHGVTLHLSGMDLVLPSLYRALEEPD